MESNKPIPAPAKGLAKIIRNGAVGIQAELIGAAPIHNMFGSAASGFQQAMESEQLAERITGKPVEAFRFTRGDDVVDLRRKRKGTIIRELKARAEDGQKRFEIVDSKGNAWTQKTSLLRLRG